MDDKLIEQIQQRGVVNLLNQGEDIVISGIGCKFPLSNCTDQFAENLFNHVDMITEDVNDERWPNSLYGMNNRMGRIYGIDKFDQSFFGYSTKYAGGVDPESRILLEKTYEAIVDAGLNPQQLRGSNTGVYIGQTKFAAPDGYPQDLQMDESRIEMELMERLSGEAKTMYANRISFMYDFKGPSFVLEAACASSLVTFDLAVTDMRLGKCDMAIVGTAQLNIPFTNFVLQANKINANDGILKAWDKDANGYVRSEAITCVLLQKKSQAKRIYATVVHSKNNTDGYKHKGSFFPLKEVQQKLMEETYIEAGIDPNDIDYIEAHGTGTKAGDPQEAESIAKAYCKNRKGKLLIGLVKSNIGHGEGTSGLASLTKAIISFENNCIAANLYPKTINPLIAPLCPPFEPVMQNTPFQPHLCGVNSFGIGGSNAHTILQANPKEFTQQSFLIADKIPRIINFCGRTQDGVDYVFDFIENNPSKVTRDFLALLNEPANYDQNLLSSGFPYRGSMIIKQKDVNEDGKIEYSYSKEISKTTGFTKPIWFFFSGMGSQWIGMGKEMMKIDKFAETIHKCAQVLKQFDVDLLDILLSDDEKALNSIVNPFVAITSMQISLFEVLKQLEIEPDKIIGHSFGEIACAYADGCMTLEQAMLCSYWRGKVVEESSIPPGKMAAVGLGWEEANQKCKNNVYVACDNAPDSVTFSGLEKDMTELIENLKSEGIFVREVVGCNLKPYHSVQLEPVAGIMTKILRQVFPQPKLRSNKWLSTSVSVQNWEDESAKYASAEYFVNNLVHPVLFTSTLSQAPADAIVIEIAPHALFASLIKRTLKDVNYIGLMKRKNYQQNLETFLSSIGKLYQLGINPSIEKLYPKVEWPVARGTQSINSLIKWDHSESHFFKKYPQFYNPSTASDMTFEYSLDNPDDEFLQDHAVDGNILFPAMGYLMLAWRRLAAQKGLQWNQVPVSFENVQLKRSVQFQNGKIKLTVRYIEPSGDFVVLDSGHVAAVGKIFANIESEGLQLQHLIGDINASHNENGNNFKLNKEDFYKELKIRGYDYGPQFQGVHESLFIHENKSIGKVRHTNNSNIISTLDSIMHLVIAAIPTRTLFIPVSIESLKCDPLMFFQSLNENKTIKDKKDLNDEEENEKNQQQTEKYILEEENEKNEKSHTQNQKWHSDILILAIPNLKTLIGKGIEIKGVETANIPRRFVSNGFCLEKYQFIPYYEDNAIECYQQNELTKYLNVCEMICKLIFEKVKFNYKNKKILKNFKNIQIDQKIIDEMTTNISEEHILLNAFNSLLDVQKEFYEKFKQNLDLRFKDGKFQFDVSKDIINLVGRNQRLIKPLIDTVNENVHPIKQLNVLEINATNTILGVDISSHLTETFIDPISMKYTIAHNQPEQIKSSLEIEKIQNCNIVEWIHYNSDFPENINDKINLIIHRDSDQLWNVDLNNYFHSASKQLDENGFLLGVFRSTITTPEMIINEILEHEDQPNANQLLNRIETFEKIASKNGFKLISKKTDSILFTAVLFRKINPNIQQNEQTVIKIKNGEYQVWIDQLKQAIQEHKSKNENANIWLHANDSNINGVIGLVQCLRLESGGDKLRCIFDFDNKLPKEINFNLYPFKEILENNLVMNVYKDKNFGSFKHLSLPNNYDKIETDKAYVSVMQKGDLSSLQWFDGRNLKNPLLSTTLKIQQQDVDIYYSSLNFKDVMMGIGRIENGTETAFIENQFRTEFAGRRCDSGERVFGMSLGYGIATQTKTHEPLILSIPDQWSMEDAATVYTVYMTCWYGLIERGQLQEGESILIHSGAGGIGQAAINICQYYKCKIFTTVSTQEKRDFLKKNFGLTDDQIFNSRNTDFEQKILETTNGLGVDLVLNSLTDEKLLASFKCVCDSGRFIQIGKYNLQINPLPKSAFSKNIAFHGIDLDKISCLQKEFHLSLIKKFKIWLDYGIEKSFVKPLNRTIFKLEQVKESFEYMMTGKHIGKVLIKIRDEEDRRLVKAKPIKIIATTKSWFDSEKVYIIIGGLGGMGLEMVNWMVLRGAQKFVLTSRSGIKTDYQRYFLKQMNQLGKMFQSFKVQMKISTENVIEEQNAKNVLNEAESMGKIGGIFQLAVVLHDALFENQTSQTFNLVCKPKVDATINLDKLSRQLDYQVDYFVCFSSITCGRGNIGQSNYGYANSVMERICENRRKDGLHGLAIEWGPIGDVGALINSSNDIKFNGLLMQRLPSWLFALDKFLQCPHPVLSSLIRTESEFKVKVAEDKFMKMFWSQLGVDPKRFLNHTNLNELGMGSLLEVELQKSLENDFDINFTLEDLRKITIGEIKELETGNLEKIKQFAEDLKIAKINLSKIKFELSNQIFTKLNDISTGKPIYLLPPIESVYHHLIPLAKLLPFPVYGLNWTHELEQMKSIKEIAFHYSNIMKTLEPNGDYILLTTNLGSFIGLRMAYKKAPIKTLIVIDSNTINKTDINDAEAKNHECFEEGLKFVSRNSTKTFVERLKSQIYNIKGNENNKTNKFIQTLKSLCSTSNSSDLDVIIKGTVKKSKMIKQMKKNLLKKIQNENDFIFKDKLEKRIKCKLIIIKPSNPMDHQDSLEDNLFQEYIINKENLDVKYIENVKESEELITLKVEETAEIIKSFH